MRHSSTPSAATKSLHVSPDAPPDGSTCRHVVYTKTCGRPAKTMIQPMPKYKGYGRDRVLIEQPEYVPVCGIHRNEVLRDWQRQHDAEADEIARQAHRRKVTISENLATMLTESLTAHFGIPVTVRRGSGRTFDSSTDLTITPETAQQLLDVLSPHNYSGRSTRND